MHVLVGILATSLVVGNVILNCIPLFALGLVRMVLRLSGASRAEARLAGFMDRIIDAWVGINRIVFHVLRLTRVEPEWVGADDLSRQRWYVVVSNHQTWTDILVLQTVLHGRIPPLKFFTKRQLLWIPFLGLAMWLLDFPYVRRFSREQLAANPALRELDRQATLQACERFRDHPTSVLIFLEGTRFTTAKHQAQDAARFSHLLNPKLGGLTLVLGELNPLIHKLVDVTLVYPHGVPTFWDFMQGRCPEIRVRIEAREIPERIRSTTDEDERRRAVAAWLETLWREKDQHLDRSARPEVVG